MGLPQEDLRRDVLFGEDTSGHRAFAHAARRPELGKLEARRLVERAGELEARRLNATVNEEIVVDILEGGDHDPAQVTHDLLAVAFLLQLIQHTSTRVKNGMATHSKQTKQVWQNIQYKIHCLYRVHCTVHGKHYEYKRCGRFCLFCFCILGFRDLLIDLDSGILILTVRGRNNDTARKHITRVTVIRWGGKKWTKNLPDSLADEAYYATRASLAKRYLKLIARCSAALCRACDSGGPQ